MTIRIAIGVVAHPQRAFRHDALCQTVVPDVFNLDNFGMGCEENHIATLRKLSALDADWYVVLEDDASPLPDFRRLVGEALMYAPEQIVSLYLGTGNPSGVTQRNIRQAVMAAQSQNLAWIVADCLIPGVAYALRSDIIHDVIDGISERSEELPLRITRWAQENRASVCYTQPSLVDHEDSDPIGHPFRPPGYLQRKAWRWEQPRQGWITPAVMLAPCPLWSSNFAQ